MAVTLFLPTVLAKLADGRAIESNGDTVGAVVADVATRYQRLIRMWQQAHTNGRNDAPHTGDKR